MPKPIANFTVNIDSGCSPLTVKFYNNTITKKPSSNFWNFGDGVLQTNNLDSVTKIFNGSIYQDTIYFVKLTVTSSNGCIDTFTKGIKVKSASTAKIVLTDTILCTNALNPTKLTIQNASYGSVDTFFWNFGDGQLLTTTKDTTIYHPYSIEGIYNIVLKAKNICKVSYDTAKILIQTLPLVKFSKTLDSGCGPLIVSFTNLTTNDLKANYLWNFGNGITSTNKIPPPSIIFAQSIYKDSVYQISLKVTNKCGVFEYKDSLKVLPKPTVNFLISTDSGCSPLPVFMSNQTIGLPQINKWYFGNGDSSSRFYPLQNPVVYKTIDSISYFTIRLYASNTCGSDSMKKIVKVFPNNVRSFFTTSGNEGCQSLLVKFNDFSKGGNNISWNFGDGTSSSLQNPIHFYSDTGIFIASQYVNDGCGFDTSFVTIKVLPKPIFSIAKSNSISCVKLPLQFTAAIVNNGAITWNFGDGDSSNGYNPMHIYKTPGRKYITATLKSFTNSCVSIKKDSIDIMPLPDINLNVDTSQACLNYVFNFKGTSSNSNLFSWSFGDGNFGIGSNTTHQYQSPGTYIVKLVGQTFSGCIDSVFRTINVYPLPKADFIYNPNDTCTGPVKVFFTNKSIGANSYNWSFGNGLFSNNTNPTTIYSTVGFYSTRLIVSNQFFCYDTAIKIFKLYQAPIAGFDFTIDRGCPPLAVAFKNTSQFSSNYIWDFGDGIKDTAVNPIHYYSKPGFYFVKIQSNIAGVCFDSFSHSKKITVYPKPNSFFKPFIIYDKKPYRLVSVELNTDSIKAYEWNFGNGNIFHISKPTFRYADGDSGWHIITLKATNYLGCDSLYIDSIYLPGYWKGIFVPSAFTPSLGSGGANEFKPAGIEIAQGTYHIKVFNKWGELMWESQKLTADGQPEEAWNGNDKSGVPCMQGSYIWTVQAIFTDNNPWLGMPMKDGSLQTRGNVTLIR
ncbi:MAG: PKD domain-containing protein [Bacteroidetes bacterium]|nr:PKD domain-containing protein [Bacteroidota bacterium]